jgi:hypothetical protein
MMELQERLFGTTSKNPVTYFSFLKGTSFKSFTGDLCPKEFGLEKMEHSNLNIDSDNL